MHQHYEVQVQGEWQPVSEAEAKALEAAAEYLEQTETHDRRVCQAGVHDEASDGVPRNHYQRNLVFQNATAMRKHVCRKYGVITSEFQHALRVVQQQKDTEKKRKGLL